MKKLLLSALTLLAFTTFTFAQAKPSAKKENKKETKATVAVKKETAKNEKKEMKPASVPTKKDGTPDMRYKENKATAKHEHHMKKDGTPDKRFKENKKTKG